MNLPAPLRREIIELLSNLPNVGTSKERQALINAAGLEKHLYQQIDWEGTTATFFQNLLPALLSYGLMSDKRHPLAAVLDAAKEWAGSEKQQTCDALITALCKLPADEPSDQPTLNGVPRHLPPLDAHFVDREQQLAFLLQELQPGKVITLCGPGGIGKSALAAQAVHQLEPERFPDGILFHSFYKQPDADLALEYIARTFGVDPTPTPAMAAQLALAGKQALLMLDGAEDADDLQAVLNVRGQCGVLITTRDKRQSLTLREDIPPLHSAASQQLLAAWGSMSQHGDVAMARICGLLGGLPLAIRLVGHYLDDTGETADEYLEWLEAQPLEALDHGQHRIESINSLLSRSVAQVSAEAGRVLAVAGLLAFAPFAVEPIAAALNCTPRQCRTALGELVRYGLLLRSGERYEISHALVHAYARNIAEAEMLERLCTYYKTFAREQQKRGLDGYARLDDERAHIVHLLERCREQQCWSPIRALVNPMITYFDHRGYWTEKQIAVGIMLEAARQLEDRKDEAWCLNSLGLTADYQGDYAAALRLYEQSLTIRQEIGDKAGEGTTLNNISQIYDARGDYTTALQYLEQSLAIQQEIGDKPGEGITLSNLGLVYKKQGDNATALHYYEQSLAIQQEIGDRAGEGTTLNNISQIYDARGDYATTLQYLEQSLAIQQEIGNKAGEGRTLNNLGMVYKKQGDNATALHYYEQSLAIQQEIGNKAGEAVTCWNIGRIYQEQGDLTKAEEYMSRTVQIGEEIGRPELEWERPKLEEVRRRIRENYKD